MSDFITTTTGVDVLAEMLRALKHAPESVNRVSFGRGDDTDDIVDTFIFRRCDGDFYLEQVE